MTAVAAADATAGAPFSEPSLTGGTLGSPRFAATATAQPQKAKDEGLAATTTAEDSGWLGEYVASLRKNLEAARQGLSSDGGETAPTTKLDVQSTQHLKASVVALEGDVEALIQKTEGWRARCLEADQAIGRAQMETKVAKERQEAMEGTLLDLRLAQQQAEAAAARHEAEKRQHLRDLQEKGKELEVARLQLGDSLSRSSHDRVQHETALQAATRQKDWDLEVARLEATQARVEAHKVADDLRGKNAEVECAHALLDKTQASARRAEDDLGSTRTLLWEARQGAKKADDDLTVKSGELALARGALSNTVAELNGVRAELRDALTDNVARRTDIQAKEAELQSLSSQLRAALDVSAETRAMRQEDLQSLRAKAAEAATKTKALEAEQHRRVALERRVETLEESLKSSFRLKEKGDLELQLAVARKGFSEASGDLLAMKQELKAEQMRRVALERRNETLEDSLRTTFGRKEKEDLELRLAMASKDNRDTTSDLLAKSQELKEEQFRRAELGRRVETLENSLKASFRWKEKEDLEFQLAMSRKELREATCDLVAKQHALSEERKQGEASQARIRSLESALTLHSREAYLTSAAYKQASRAEEALDEERQTSTLLSRHVQTLEQSLQAASMKQEELNREAELFKARGDYQEMVNQNLRLDVQVAISAPSSPLGRRGLTRLADISPPSAPVSPQSARLDYPRASTVGKFRKEVLTARGDRTSALSRYDSKGHLMSYDAQGRRIV